MKARKLVPLILLLASPLAAMLYGQAIDEWHQSAIQTLNFSPLLLSIGICLLLPIPPALMLNQTRVVLLAIVLGGIFALSEKSLFITSVQGGHLLLPVLALQISLLTILRERGLFNRFGMIRLGIAVFPILILYFLDPWISQLINALESFAAWTLQPPPGLSTPYTVLVLSILLVIPILRLRGAVYPLISPAFAGIVVAVALALNPSSIFWSGMSADVSKYLGFVSASMMLSWCVYILSWGRAYQDELTGLPGRRALEEQLIRLTGTYSLVMVDVDHFKRFNDRYGHQVGDEVLQLVAKTLDKYSPGKSYRYGGEEFTIICPGVQPLFLEKKLNELRKRIAGQKLVLRKNRKTKDKKKKSVSVTASFGVAGRT